MAGARKFEELICWQLADELKARIYIIISTGPVSKDFDYCRGIRKSARSAPALIAEGFGRWSRREFVRYLRLATGELGETRNHLRDGLQANYVPVETYRQLWHLSFRAIRAC